MIKDKNIIKMLGVLSALILLTILLPASCKSNETSSTHNSISGHVCDKKDQTPIKDALIRIEQTGILNPSEAPPTPYTPVLVFPPQNPVKLETRTNAEGYYSLKGLPIGYYSITAMAAKYLESLDRFTITENSNVVKDFMISKGSSISGHIYSAGDMKPIAGATIQVWPNFVSPYRAFTAADGSYTVDLREGGSWTVWAGAPGYVAKIYDGGTGTCDWKIQYKVVTQYSANTPNIDFVLERGGSITGQIFESDGITPAVNAYVQYLQVSGTITPGLWTTDLPSRYPPDIHADASGRYCLGERLTGTYRLNAVRFTDNKTSPQVEVKVFMGQNTIQDFVLK